MGTATEKTSAQLEVDERKDGTAVITDPDAPTQGAVGNAGDDAHDDPDLDENGDGVVGSASADDAGDAPAGDAPADGEASVQERRRKERQNARQRAREREDRLRQDLARKDSAILEMRQRLDHVERRTTVADVAQIDNAVATAQREVAQLQDLQARAISAQNGAAAADATARMFAAQQKLNNLANIRQQIGKVQAAPPVQALPDPAVISQARAWSEKNSWYNPAGTDTDSNITRMLDQEVSREGFVPQSEAYWKELDKRVGKYLPHRAANSGANGDTVGSDTRRPRSVVPGGGSRESGGDAPGRTFTLSAERVQALKDAGYWNDPKLRSDMIRRYRELDKTAARQR